MSPSASSSSNPTHDGLSSSSYFQKTVCLFDWWLSKAENEFGVKGLAVAGFTSREKQMPVRLFTSAPIVKRYDVFTLETADGICVILNGFVNKSRTTENGFPSDVFKHFIFGFPINWKIYAEEFMQEEHSVDKEMKNVSECDKSTRDAASAGMRHSIPYLSPCKNKKKSAENSSFSGSSFVSDSNNEGNVENNPSMVQNEPQTDLAASSAKKDVNSGKQYATCNHPHPLVGDINAGSSVEHDITVPAEPSGPCVMESSERMGTPESSGGGRQRSSGQSKSKGSGSIELSTPSFRKCSDTLQSAVETNLSTPSIVSTDIANESRNNVGSRIINRCLRSSNDDQKQKQSFVRHKNKGSASEAFKYPGTEQLHGSPSDAAVPAGGIKNKSVTRTSRLLVRLAKCSPGKLRKEKKKQVAAQEGCSSGKIAKSSLGNLRTEKEQVAVHVECSSGKKTKRKINFDTQETPLNQKKRAEEASFTPPESLSFKRSRSGRLLLPSLEFWRNQIPVYDADHRLTGIQGLNAGKSSKGSRSEPQKSRKQGK